MNSTAVELTPQQVESYKKNGYISVEALTTPEELEQIREIYERIFHDNPDVANRCDVWGVDVDGEERRTMNFTEPSRFEPALLEMQFMRNAERIAKQILGPEAKFSGDIMLYKQAKVGHSSPWHQDEAWCDPNFDYKFVGVWLTLDDTNVESGCMHYIPGSHKEGMQLHRRIHTHLSINLMQIDDVDESRAVSVPLKAGGAAFHDGRTLHFGKANSSPNNRRAYVCRFWVEPVKRDTPQDFPWQRNVESDYFQKHKA